MRYTSTRNNESHQLNENNNYANIITRRTNLIRRNKYTKVKDRFKKWLTYEAQFNDKLNNKNNRIH